VSVIPLPVADKLTPSVSPIAGQLAEGVLVNDKKTQRRRTMAKKVAIGNRCDSKGHKVSTNAHAKGHLKISVAKKGVKKHHKGGSKKTMLT